MTAYDRWLELPYQDACASESAYETALESATEAAYQTLKSLTVGQLLEQYREVPTKLHDILATRSMRSLREDPLRITYLTVHVLLESVIQALANQLGEEAAQSQSQTSCDCYPPDPDDFPESDRDCDYWERTK